MIKDKIGQFYGSRFKFENKEYAVKDCKEKDQKALIFTDKRTFAFYENELDVFLNEISFLNAAPASGPSEVSQVGPAKESRDVFVPEMPSLRAEIILSNERASRISQKLEDMFDRLSDNPSDETIRQAKAMQDLSNSIVNVESLKFKMLTTR